MNSEEIRDALAGYKEGYADAETGRALVSQGDHSDAWWAGYLTGHEEQAMDSSAY